MKNLFALFAVSVLCLQGSADEVVTQNGSIVKGRIVGIVGDKLSIETDFAGKLEISKDQIATFSTEEPINISFESGNIYVGKVSGTPDGKLTIATTDGDLSTSITGVSESWQPGVQSPADIRQQAELETLKRKWSYEASFDLTGKNGNSESLGLGTQFRAKLQGPDDALQFYAKANFEETDDTKSADDARVGIDYANNITDQVSWYLRSEFGRDVIAATELFVNTAAGFGWTPMTTEQRTLTLRGGISYRFETYEVGLDDFSSAGVDLGLFHEENFTWGKLVNRLTYTPAFDDFGNFRVTQDSALELPTKSDAWKLRIGFANDYNSEPVPGIDELDTTYYTRLVFVWD